MDRFSSLLCRARAAQREFSAHPLLAGTPALEAARRVRLLSIVADQKSTAGMGLSKISGIFAGADRTGANPQPTRQDFSHGISL
jgi:hypothetical protein